MLLEFCLCHVLLFSPSEILPLHMDFFQHSSIHYFFPGHPFLLRFCTFQRWVMVRKSVHLKYLLVRRRCSKSPGNSDIILQIIKIKTKERCKPQISVINLTPLKMIPHAVDCVSLNNICTDVKFSVTSDHLDRRTIEHSLVIVQDCRNEHLWPPPLPFFYIILRRNYAKQTTHPALEELSARRTMSILNPNHDDHLQIWPRGSQVLITALIIIMEVVITWFYETLSKFLTMESVVLSWEHTRDLLSSSAEQ